MADNSPIQAKGVGKNSKRHDLSGTPGLHDSSLQQGDVQTLEQGQKAVNQISTNQEMQAAQAQQMVAPGQAPIPPDAGGISVPDPMSFALSKLGGQSLEQAGTQPVEQKQSFSNWLPLLRRLAVSPTSSGLLQRAYVARISAEMQRPTGGSTALLRQRDFDKALEQLLNER